MSYESKKKRSIRQIQRVINVRQQKLWSKLAANHRAGSKQETETQKEGRAEESLLDVQLKWSARQRASS
jgi:hypothetical protein